MILSSLFLAFSAAAATATTPVLTRRTNATKVSVRTIYEFPDNTTWIENIAVRPNGNLLVTLLTAPEVHEISTAAEPLNNASARHHLVHRFDGNTGLLGVAEVAPDVFAVVGGNFSTASPAVATSSFAVWTVDCSASSSAKCDGSAPRLSEPVPVPGAALLNGATALPGQDGLLLVADSALGEVRRVDTRGGGGGAVSTFLADPATMGAGDGSVPVGVDGVRFDGGDDGYLYYTNYAKGLLCRVRVDGAGEATGAVEVVAEGLPLADDFAVRGEEVYVMEGAVEGVVRVPVGRGGGGTPEVLVAGFGDPVGRGSTAAAFGRRRGVDDGVLYIVTGGGKVVAVDVGS